MKRNTKTPTFADKALHFYKNLNAPGNLPPGIEVMNPYKIPQVQEYTEKFFTKFFSDTKDRTFVFGINPGRLGGGVTGVAFTDPVALREFCGIPNTLGEHREMSSRFVYKFIEHWGGAEKFYGNFFLTAVSPLGFTKDGRNYNYYGDPALFDALKPFIIETMKSQLALGAQRKAAIVLGKRKNVKFFREINEEYKFFKELYPLPHPRYIRQYQRRNTEKYLKEYSEVFSAV